MPTQTTLRDDIMQRLVRKPFAPFAVHMSNGHRYLIVRPFQMACGQTVATVGEPTGDRSSSIKLSDVVSVVDL